MVDRIASPNADESPALERDSLTDQAIQTNIRVLFQKDLKGGNKKMNIETKDDAKLSRRSFMAALLSAVVIAPVVSLTASDADAQERQFTSFRHQPRTSRPRSPTRGSRRHRRVARVRHTGRPQPRPDAAAPTTPAPTTPAQ